ncbi:MAG: hypothetical protein AAB766_04610 [Patescibacteria group bacterium]
MTEQPKLENKEQKSFLDQWIEKEFNEEYDAQVRVLHDLRLLEVFPGKDVMGIIGIDGKEYPVPTKADIIAEIKANPEKYEKKMKQGFTKIQLTPFALPLERLTTLLSEKLLDRYNRRALFDVNRDLMELDIREPLHVWSGFVDPEAPEGRRGADVTGKSIYHPTSFHQKDHHGQTKDEILKAQAGLPFSGWEVKLIEQNQSVGNVGNVGGRENFRMGEQPAYYLSLLMSDPQYANEQGLLSEDWLIQILVSLERFKRIDDELRCNLFFGNMWLNPRGSVLVSNGQWSGFVKQLTLFSNYVYSPIGSMHVRTAVPIGPQLVGKKLVFQS